MSRAFNRDLAWHGFKLRIDHQLRPNRTSTQLGAGEVQIILLFETMIGEFIAGSHADSPRLPVGTDQVDCRNLTFLAAVLCECRYFKWLAVCAQYCSGAFIKPFGRNANAAVRRAPPINSPA